MNNSPIGVFDSGLGGISVLKKAVEILPNESFIYYGDSANAPYGVRSDEDAYKLSSNVFRQLLEMGCKAVLVACNTATSVAVQKLRLQYPDIPLVGIEPAIKPAVENHQGGTIVVMATEVTLRRKKFADLMEKYGHEADIIPMPCPGLMEFVEQDKFDSPELMEYLKVRYDKLGDKKADAVVLGCTHYPFLARQIRQIAGSQAVLYDGSEGTSRELRRRLAEKDMLASEDNKLKVTILNSAGQERIELSKRLFKEKIYL